ncbi:MAG TPA: hypothetical protein PKV91_08820 [Bacillota bacterium]|nr:hypothetical protein [Bacillota bacterium]HPZ12436.1 hypothetical protein [Bacillota bacterium]
MNKYLPRCLLLLVIVLWVILMMSPWTSPAQAADPDLIITGTGLKKDVIIYPHDWENNYNKVTRYYSSNNTLNFHHIWKVRGYDLFDIIKTDNLVDASKDYLLTFVARNRDGTETRISRTMNDLKNRYYYPHFDPNEEIPVPPMIGFERADLYEHQGLPVPADVVWGDKPFERDNDAPRLYFGQAKGNVSDKNMTFFLYGLFKIVVGEERPPGDDGDDGSEDSDGSGSGGGGTGTTTPPGGGSSGTGTTQPPGGSGPGTGTTKPPAPGTQPPAPEPGKEQDPGDPDEAEADQPVAGPGKETEEPGDEEEGEDDPAAKPEEEPDLDNETGSKKRKVIWPWIAAGAALVAGGAGGVYYYIICRRRG